MYVILTSKPGQYRAELTEGMERIEVYDYVLSGRNRACFVIAKSTGDAVVRVIDEVDASVNLVPVKFFPTFETREQASQELKRIASFGHLDIKLVKR